MGLCSIALGEPAGGPQRERGERRLCESQSEARARARARAGLTLGDFDPATSGAIVRPLGRPRAKREAYGRRKAMAARGLNRLGGSARERRITLQAGWMADHVAPCRGHRVRPA
jgi:hypothetical protein